VKLKKLKEAYIAAKTKAAKEKIIEKASRVAPSLTEERFVEIAE